MAPANESKTAKVVVPNQHDGLDLLLSEKTNDTSGFSVLVPCPSRPALNGRGNSRREMVQSNVTRILDAPFPAGIVVSQHGE